MGIASLLPRLGLGNEPQSKVSSPASLKLACLVSTARQLRGMFPLILRPSRTSHGGKLMLVDWVHTVLVALTDSLAHGYPRISRDCCGETLYMAGSRGDCIPVLYRT